MTYNSKYEHNTPIIKDSVSKNKTNFFLLSIQINKTIVQKMFVTNLTFCLCVVTPAMVQ